MKKITDKIIRVILACILLVYVFSCQEDLNSDIRIDQSGVSIMEYLDQNPAYSTLVEALNRVGLSQNLKIYGTMTLFAPTNDAFAKFLDNKGVASVSDIDVDELKNILLYHLYNNRYDSGFFVSGSFANTTVNGNFIKMNISNGVRNTVLNDNTLIDSLDISASNGVVHVIDNVLEPPHQSLYGWLKEKDEYSIMLEAFEKTGNDTAILDKIVYDPLNIQFGKPKVKWKTVFLETNEVLNDNGIYSFQDLVDRYSNTSDYTLTADSLNIFVKYHCIEQKMFMSDFKTDYIESIKSGAYLIFDVSSGLSINNQEKIITVTNPETGQDEQVKTFVSVGMNAEQSNEITNNGIIHSVDDLLEPYDPPAVELNLLFAGAPEDRNVLLTDGTTVNVTDPDAFNTLNNDVDNQNRVWWLNWGGNMIGKITSSWPANTFGDYACVIDKNDGEYWLEMTTKPIFKGTYKVYVTYRRTNNTNYFVQFYWDDEELGDLTDLRSSKDAFGNSIGGTDRRLDRQIGVLTFEEMAPHKFKLYLPNPGTNYTAWYSLVLKPI